MEPSIIKYFIDKASFLSEEFEEQIQLESEIGFYLGDYLTVDIANDWLPEDIKVLKKLVDEKILDIIAVELYQAINENFTNVSAGGKSFDEKIWTLEALKNHPFWKEQRHLAGRLLDELKPAQTI